MEKTDTIDTRPELPKTVAEAVEMSHAETFDTDDVLKAVRELEEKTNMLKNPSQNPLQVIKQIPPFELWRNLNKLPKKADPESLQGTFREVVPIEDVYALKSVVDGMPPPKRIK